MKEKLNVFVSSVQKELVGLGLLVRTGRGRNVAYRFKEGHD